ncbi:hypothetical protein RhiirA1_533592 [Rhizophagus irregularis]|uniref:UBA domain-containing protein n=1 Tax=Rhizophagus irregularis TaxID=588596 RepID=A0A2N0S0Z4_9GLOM|nr:hypothetical protein RhiirA1_533592 [Rhizophagus irregularis]CAB4484245.1 unnamed protein product [Rhizophagus irregularis]
MQKPQRVAVQKETITAFSTYKYFHSPTNKFNHLDAKDIKEEIAKAKFYKNGSILSREIVTENQEKPVVKVVNNDCLIEALELKKKGYRPLVLNMASATSVGGGYKNGAGAQEENLFRRTNLFQYHESNKKDWYPIPEIGGIYCPNATIIRSSEQDQYEFLEVPEMMSFVAVAAMRSPRLVKNHSGEFALVPEAKKLTQRKIQAILNIGLDNGHDAIVLSAFGCGAYRNPPSIMAQLFYEVISTEYAGGGVNLPKTYRHISFAIIDDHNSNKEHNPEGNFLPFQNKFANGLDDRPISDISDAMDSIQESSEQVNQQNLLNNNNNNKSKNEDNYDYRRNNVQNRRPYNEIRGKGRGKVRGGFGREGSSQTHGKQMTLDAVWKYKPSQDHIDQLIRMGYSAKISKRALYTTEGNMEEAVNWLMQNAISDKMINLSIDKNES